MIFTLLPQLMQFVSEERKRHTVYPPAEQVFTWSKVCDITDVSVAHEYATLCLEKLSD